MSSRPYAYTTATAKTPIKKYLHFTLEFHVYLNLFSVYVGMKTWPCLIRYEYVQFQIEIRKFRRSECPLSKNLKLVSSHIVDLPRGSKKCIKNYICYTCTATVLLIKPFVNLMTFSVPMKSCFS